MISYFRNLSIISSLLLLVGSFQGTAIANIHHQPQLITQRTNPQPHSVFQTILPKLKQRTQVPVILPKYIPDADGENPIYAIIETATKNKYEILLGYSPDCSGGTACRLGIVTGETITRKTPRLIGKRVTLNKGITGYFVDFKCGANCSDATLTWRQNNSQYTIGLKAGDRTSLIKMANSAIAP
jgi:hypothetical protein